MIPKSEKIMCKERNYVFGGRIAICNPYCGIRASGIQGVGIEVSPLLKTVLAKEMS